MIECNNRNLHFDCKLCTIGVKQNSCHALRMDQHLLFWWHMHKMCQHEWLIASAISCDKLVSDSAAARLKDEGFRSWLLLQDLLTFCLRCVASTCFGRWGNMCNSTANPAIPHFSIRCKTWKHAMITYKWNLLACILIKCKISGWYFCTHTKSLTVCDPNKQW